MPTIEYKGKKYQYKSRYAPFDINCSLCNSLIKAESIEPFYYIDEMEGAFCSVEHLQEALNNKISATKIFPSELPQQPSGAIYHLNLFPEDIADDVIIVGDPDRVEVVSNFFDSIELKKHNRELYTHTGYLNNHRITVLSSGMGTDNIDIVINELDALANVDFKTMEPKTEHRCLNIIRLGTSGSLASDVKIGSYVAATHGLGLDGLLHFYDSENVSDTAFVEQFVKFTGWGDKLPYPYCVEGSRLLLDKIAGDMVKGITASAPGFFGPQGRRVRIPLSYPLMNERIEHFSYQNRRITNLEMECSAIYGLCRLLGHNALTVCLIIANRVSKQMLNEYHENMNDMIGTVLDRLTR